ncbi:MAG: hypothetical protein ACLQBY_01910 [Solirubrobacteraceae bacterium]
MAVVAGTASARPAADGSLSLKAAGSSGAGSLSRSVRVPTIAFTAEYDAEGYYGAVKCKGKHETNAGLGYPGTPTEGGRDVERCKSTTGKRLVGLAPGETVSPGGWFPGSSGWDSDYDSQAATSIEYTVSGNGKSFKLVAYYPFAG